MRDPQRIDLMLELISDVWKKHPDLRLTQILVNALNPKTPVPEVFYAEDDLLLDRLREFARKLEGDGF